MAERSKWTVSYDALTVAEAARQRKEHHEARLTHWQERRIQAEKDLRENGIVIDEIPEPMHSNYAGGPRYDRVLKERHDEAALKVQEHVKKVKNYAAWERMLMIAHERSQQIDLDVEDVEFFGL